MTPQSDAELMLRLVLADKISFRALGWPESYGWVVFGQDAILVNTVNGLPVLTPELRAELERLEQQ